MTATAVESVARQNGAVAPRGGMATTLRLRYAFLGWLALPMLLYLVPLAEGFAWNAIGPSYLPFNVLNPPEEYRGRIPTTRITAEGWGASVLIVPLHARIRQFLGNGELPLWNPYQGLGQPLAAQGEGNPYFPAAILRALVPYSLENYVTLVVIYLSAVCTYLFLVRLGASAPAATFAGVAWSLSGAVTLHIARPNLGEQVCMIPVLFWATLAAAQERTAARYVVLVLISCLHLLAGFIQIAMLSGLGAALFGGWVTWLQRTSVRAWPRESMLVVGSFALGNALAGFYLLPTLDAMRTTFNKNVAAVGFLVPHSDASIVGFLMPYFFGQPFYESWMGGANAPVVDWDNLFAFAGLVPAAVVVTAVPGVVRGAGLRATYFWFFAGGFVVMLLRYLSAPPFGALNLLPILDRQTPKHANGVMVFFLIVAAGLALDVLPRLSRRQSWIGLGSLLGFLVGLVLTIVGRRGGFGQIEPGDILGPALAISLAVIALVVLVVWLSVGRPGEGGSWVGGSAKGVRRAAILLGGVSLAELSIYLPLGNAEPWFLLSRLGIGLLIAGAAVLLAFGWARVATVVGLGAIVAYVVLLPTPRSGLPRQFDADQLPAFMRWLAATGTADDRSFGIFPDWSSLAPIQDIETVGPLAPPEFVEFITLIADEPTAQSYRSSTNFMLTGAWSKYDLGLYARARPILDWAGVRYLVLNKQLFGSSTRRDAAQLQEPPLSLPEVYEDRRVYILASPEAQSKAEFWSGYIVADDQASILARFKRDPAAIKEAPRVEQSQLPPGLTPPSGEAVRTTVPLGRYRPNEVELTFDAASGGLLVLKDVYAAGWDVTLNGSPTPMVRVNGLVRGVFVPDSGRYTVRFTYMPVAFVYGAWLSLATVALLIVVGVSAAIQARSGRGRLPMPEPRRAPAEASPVATTTAVKILPHAP